MNVFKKKQIHSPPYTSTTSHQRMVKVAINTCYGGFSLSEEAQRLYGGDADCRSDPALIRVVEELGDRAAGDYSRLKIVDVPDDVDWVIQEYDGIEWVAERHRTWS